MSMRLRPTCAAHSKHYVWRCYASPTAASGVTSALLNAAISATMCAAATPQATARNLLKPLAPRCCSLLYYAVDGAVCWQPLLLIYYAMYEPMPTPRSVYRLGIAHHMHLWLSDLKPG